MTLLLDLHREARARLAAAEVASPESDAVELASFVLDVEPREVRRRLAFGVDVDPDRADTFRGLVAERANRVPLQHLTGRAYFRHLTLHVGPGVFIPRPETEVVAGLAIAAARAAGVDQPVVVDLCTGSGAIALAVKDEVPSAQVYAVETSDLALAWARRNHERLGLDVELRLGDAVTAFGDLVGRVDVVVSNPPYIPVGQVPVDPEVAEHDPPIALYGGSADGLSIPRLVAARGAALCRPGGVLVMEHADTQGPALLRALAATGDWVDLDDHLDLAGRPRAVVARRLD
ncbi:MAG: peptide chain release factor N(5)-glutamine methyltransferase [Tetrasphaera sp.]